MVFRRGKCPEGADYYTFLGKCPPTPPPTPPKATLTLTSHLGQNVGLGEGRWAVSQKRIMVRSCSLFRRTTEKIFSHFKFLVLVFFQNATADFITNCDGLLLKSATGITKCDRYYKVRQNNASIR